MCMFDAPGPVKRELPGNGGGQRVPGADLTADGVEPPDEGVDGVDLMDEVDLVETRTNDRAIPGHTDAFWYENMVRE